MHLADRPTTKMNATNNLQYAKKMVVVPQELITRLEQHSNPSVSTNIKHNSSGLDAEMTRILHDKEMDDNEKWKQYQQVLQRHLHMTSTKREPINLPIVETEFGLSQDRKQTQEETIREQMQRSSSALVDEIVDSFPKTYKNETRSLLRTLARKGDISWDSDNHVYIRNQKIPNSNIVDILHSIVRTRKTDPPPPGWYEVMHALKDMRIPTTYINNAAALRFLNHEPIASTSTSSSEIAATRRVPSTRRLTSRQSTSRQSTGGVWESFTTPRGAPRFPTRGARRKATRSKPY